MEKKRERHDKTGIGVITLFVFILVSFSGCAAGFLGIGGGVSWKEEVLLHDGSKIIVERWQKHGGRHELGQNPGISDQSITFTVPGTNKTITWKDEASAELGERANFELFALHILKNTPYIITSPYLCLSYNKWGRPNPPYIIFKYVENEWKRIEMTELPLEFNNINLVINSNSHEGELISRGLTSAERVKELNRSLTQAECKEIIRTPLKGVGCMKLIYAGGHWRSLDWFTSKPSFEACLKFCEQKNIKEIDCPCDSLFKGGK